MKTSAHASALALVTLLIAGCKQRPPESTPPPITTTAASADAESTAPPSTTAPMAPSAAAAEFREAARALPQGEVGSFRQTGAVMRLSAANLSQAIDGDAVSYQAYNVTQYAKTDYRKANSRLVATVSTYEFADALGAFGRFSMALSSGRDPSSLQSQAVLLGGGGFLGRTQLLFWKGTFLVQIDLTDESEDVDEPALFAAAREVLPALGRAVERAVTGATVAPTSPLPSAALVWGGATYLAQNVLGLGETGAGWLGWYRAEDGKRHRVAHFASASNDEAHGRFARLRGARSTAIPGFDEAASATLDNVGEVVIARSGSNVVMVTDGGVEGAPSPDRAAKIALARAALGLH